MGGKVASLGRVWNRFSLHKNRPNVLLKIFAYFSRVYIFAKMINLQLQIFSAAFEQIFVAEFANIEHIV